MCTNNNFGDPQNTIKQVRLFSTFNQTNIIRPELEELNTEQALGTKEKR